MYRKIAAISALIICSAIYLACLNETFVKICLDFRNRQPFFEPSRKKYGDLYNFSLLPRFRIPNYPIDDVPICRQSGNIDLYLLRDSYLLGNVDRQNFCGVNRLVAGDWNNESSRMVFVQKSPHRKILILEITERNVFLVLKRVAYIQGKFHLEERNVRALTSTVPDKVSLHSRILVADEALRKLFFNPVINQNLDNLLFDNALFRPVREAKAEFNYRIFGRLNEKVSVTAEGDYLLLAETVSADSPGSSFRAIGANEMRELIQNLNLIYDHYNKLGFDEVYLSIIPNPASILGARDQTYNNLIPRLAGDKSLRMKMIDIFPQFKREQRQIYSRSDTHWVSLGLRLWLQKTNAVLSRGP